MSDGRPISGAEDMRANAKIAFADALSGRARRSNESIVWAAIVGFDHTSCSAETLSLTYLEMREGCKRM